MTHALADVKRRLLEVIESHEAASREEHRDLAEKDHPDKHVRIAEERGFQRGLQRIKDEIERLSVW
ncbi:MAG: hypothetical protein MI723_14035 [Caulobacterales bacterium]|nr:hypothetical protein [Caulobacterales bacterium]